MLEAVLWGLVQGLTEFLPVSSSGHLVLVPELLGIDPPDLATTAVLHIGTLVAVIVYYRRDLRWLAGFRSDRQARTSLLLLGVGTIPAVAVLALEGTIESVQASAAAVAWLLSINGVVLLVSGFFRGRERALPQGKAVDGFLVGIAQMLAAFPGLSRSGLTITTGMGRDFRGEEAARFSFLLGIPVILAAGSLEGLELAQAGGLTAGVWVGVVVAAVAGYVAIDLVLRMVNRFGLRPFAYYCWALSIVVLATL